MGKLAGVVCGALAVVGAVLILIQLTSMMAVGTGHGLQNTRDFIDAMSVDPTAKYALTWFIAGVVGLIVLAIARRPVRKAPGAAGPAPEVAPGEGEGGTGG